MVSAAILLVLVAALFPATLRAHTDPPGSTGTQVNISLTAFRSDGVTPVFPMGVDGCGETILYQATLSWGGAPNAAFQGGTLTIVTPDGVPHDVTPIGGIPCLGGTDGLICTPGVTSLVSQFVPYTVNFDPLCTPPGDVISAVVAYTNGTAHLGANDTPGVAASTVLPAVVVCCAPTPTPTPTVTNTPTNTPTGVPNTPTNTPTPSEAPPVPTLSFPMMALLGLLLAGTGLFLARRL
jgi:hypothetical protein